MPSVVSDATPSAWIPHGTISRNPERSVATLSAKPCMVIQRESRTPIAPILASRGDEPGAPTLADGTSPRDAARPRASSQMVGALSSTQTPTYFGSPGSTPAATP